MSKITAYRYHDISCGHRVVGHEGKCIFPHGHNYRVHFFCSAPALDKLGRIIDFGVIKLTLCQWLEDNWDHKMLLWEQDPSIGVMKKLYPGGIVTVPFNPTAEALANHLLQKVGPVLLFSHEVRLTKVIVDETRKCSAIAEL